MSDGDLVWTLHPELRIPRASSLLLFPTTNPSDGDGTLRITTYDAVFDRA